MDNNQKNSFLSYEANAWFERNFEVISNYNPDDDRVVDLFKKYNFDKQSILEIGSSAGYRLNALKNLIPNTNVYGIEPSQKAIEYGENLSLIHI